MSMLVLCDVPHDVSYLSEVVSQPVVDDTLILVFVCCAVSDRFCRIFIPRRLYSRQQGIAHLVPSVCLSVL